MDLAIGQTVSTPAYPAYWHPRRKTNLREKFILVDDYMYGEYVYIYIFFLPQLGDKNNNYLPGLILFRFLKERAISKQGFFKISYLCLLLFNI